MNKGRLWVSYPLHPIVPEGILDLLRFLHCISLSLNASTMEREREEERTCKLASSHLMPDARRLRFSALEELAFRIPFRLTALLPLAIARRGRSAMDRNLDKEVN